MPEDQGNALSVTIAKWRPIETAPKDGTRVMLWHDWVSIGRWVPDFIDPQNEKAGSEGAWVLFPCEMDPYYAEWTRDATHWLPLPEPPDA